MELLQQFFLNHIQTYTGIIRRYDMVLIGLGFLQLAAILKQPSHFFTMAAIYSSTSVHLLDLCTEIMCSNVCSISSVKVSFS